MSISIFSNLPKDYTIKKFYEYGYGVEYVKSSDSYHCSCPICMEGKSFGKKKRCWYIPAKDLIYCHNCGWSSRPLKWIMQVGDLSRRDIETEIEAGDYNIINLDKKKSYEIDLDNLIKDEMEDILPKNSIDLNNELQLSYYKGNSVVIKALNYIKNRRLDTCINSPKSFFLSLCDTTHKNRIVIPFYDENDKILFYQSRAFGGNLDDNLENVKYLSKKNAQKSIFNLNNIKDEINEIFLFEGPIDSCFIENGVAVGGINPSSEKNFTELQESQLECFKLTHDFIWMLDSQWLDEAAYEKTIKLLEKGEKVFIWPEKLGRKYKDFNELCVSNGFDYIPRKFVLENILSGENSLLKYKLIMKNR